MKPLMEVESAAAARTLSAGSAVEFLAPFVEAPRSVAEASNILGKPLKTVHYWASRLTKVALLEIVDEIPRPGRKIKVYRSAAASFRIPADLLPEGYFERTEAIRQAAIRSGLMQASPSLVHDGAVVVTFGDGGESNIDRELPERREDTLHTFSTILLTRTEAKDLQRELWHVLEKFRTIAAERQNTLPYHVSVAMAPETPPR